MARPRRGHQLGSVGRRHGVGRTPPNVSQPRNPPNPAARWCRSACERTAGATRTAGNHSGLRHQRNRQAQQGRHRGMNDRSIAITGMACVFPGATSLDEFWENIVNGVDSVTEIPPGRMNLSNRFPITPDDETYVPCHRGGFLPAELRFDPRRYGIMPNIVTNGDPDQFVMLDVAAKALADAGIDDDSQVRE